MSAMDEMRASDADREQVVEQLREHGAAGRLTVEELETRIEEVVLATNPTTTGEATAHHVAELLRGTVTITRLASGLPVGADLEHADEVTLGRALAGRRSLDG